MKEVYVVFTETKIDGELTYDLVAFEKIEDARKYFDEEVNKITSEMGDAIEGYEVYDDEEDVWQAVNEDSFADDEYLIYIKTLEVK